MWSIAPGGITPPAATTNGPACKPARRSSAAGLALAAHCAQAPPGVNCKRLHEVDRLSGVDAHPDAKLLNFGLGRGEQV